MKGKIVVIALEVVMRVVWMIFSIKGWLGHFLECKPSVGVGLVSVIAIFMVHKGVKAEGVLLACKDGEDGVHTISHVGVVFVDAVDNHQAQMLLGDELAEF